MKPGQRLEESKGRGQVYRALGSDAGVCNESQVNKGELSFIHKANRHCAVNGKKCAIIYLELFVSGHTGKSFLRRRPASASG